MKKIEIKSSWNNKKIGEIDSFTEKEILASIDKVSKFQYEWNQTDYKVRSRYLAKASQLLIENVDELSELIMQEVGKPNKISRDEVIRSAEYIDLTIEEYENIKKENFSFEMNSASAKKTGNFFYVPVGTILAISPFNYPLNLALTKIAPALLAGNTVIFKPSSQGSLIGSRLIEILYEAGVPESAIVMITGKGSEIGEILNSHEIISKLNFTGSTETGKSITRQLQRPDVVLELGGKDVAIVTKFADLSKAVPAIVNSSFQYSGQRCTATKRVVVDSSIYSDFLNKIHEEVRKVKVGMPDNDSLVVPMINAKAASYAKKLIDDSEKMGAQIIFGGKLISENFLEPTLMSEVTKEMPIFRFEQFAPIIPVIKSDSLEHSIILANDSNYGLQASIYTEDSQEALYIANKLDVGTVNINAGSARGPDIFPYIGVKDSGIGVQGVKWAILSFMRIKGIVKPLK